MSEPAAPFTVPGRTRFRLGAVSGVALTLLLGCQSIPCPRAATIAELRGCLVEDTEHVAVSGETSLAPDELAADIAALGSPDFMTFARAGESLAARGEPALEPLWHAAPIEREIGGMIQDPMDRVILVIYEGLTPARRTELLSDPRPLARLYAVRSIRFREAQDETPSLIAALDDPSYHVREEALEALYSLAGESRRPASRLYGTPTMRQEREIRMWKQRSSAATSLEGAGI